MTLRQGGTRVRSDSIERFTCTLALRSLVQCEHVYKSSLADLLLPLPSVVIQEQRVRLGAAKDEQYLVDIL